MYLIHTKSVKIKYFPVCQIVVVSVKTCIDVPITKMMSDEDSMLYSTGYPLNWSYNISQYSLLSSTWSYWKLRFLPKFARKFSVLRKYIYFDYLWFKNQIMILTWDSSGILLILLLMNLNTKEHKSHLFWLGSQLKRCCLPNFNKLYGLSIICLLFLTISRLLALAKSYFLLVIDNLTCVVARWMRLNLGLESSQSGVNYWG